MSGRALLIVALACALWGCPSSPEPSGAAPPLPTPRSKDVGAPAPAFALVDLPHRPSPVFPAGPGGAQWTKVAPEVSAGLLTALAPFGSGAVVSTADGELFSVDAGGVWAKLGPTWGAPIADVASGRSAKGVVAVAALDAAGRLHLSLDGGVSWRLARGEPEGFESRSVVWDRRESPYRAIALRWLGEVLTVVACGRSTHAVYSRDGGATWVEAQLGGLEDLTACAVGGDGALIAVGERGVGFRLDADQVAWSHVPMEGQANAEAVAVHLEEVDGFVVGGQGGVLRRATKRGNTWEALDRPSGDISALALVDARRWLAVTQAGDLLETRDAGKGWSVLRASDGRRLREVEVLEGGAFMALGPELLLRGERGGRLSALRDERALRAVWSLDQGRAVAAGEGGRILRVEAGALSSVAPPGLVADVTDLAFAGGRFGWATTRSGVVLSTQDGARGWVGAGPMSEAGVLRSVVALDPLNVFVGAEDGRVWSSGDRGASWRSVEVSEGEAGRGGPSAVVDLALVEDVGGAQVFGGGARGEVLMGSPGRRGVVLEGMTALRGIASVSSAGGRAWLVDVEGMILRREGDLWRAMALPAGLSLTQGAFDGAGAGVVLASSGAMLRTSDGGASWWFVPHGTDKALNGVAAAGGGVFVAVGHGGAIRRSADGGARWADVPSEAGRSLMAAAAMDGGLVAVGLGGVALQSLDGGVVWSKWQGAPGDLGQTHLGVVEVGPEGRALLGGVGRAWIREGGGWVSLKASGEGRLGEVRRAALGPGGEALTVESTGVLRRRRPGSGELEEVSWSRGEERPRWRDVRVLSWAPFEARALLDDGIFAIEGDFDGEVRWREVSPERSPGARSSAWSVDAGGRLWLMGSGGLWCLQAGDRWAQVVTSLPVSPSSLSFRSAQEGFAVGRGGAIFRTTDGGERWQSEGGQTRTGLEAVHVSSKGEAWASGEGGVLLWRQGRVPGDP